MFDKIRTNIMTLALFTASCTVAMAGNGMSGDQAQQMMKQARKMQECMAGIDQSRLEALSAQAESMQQEIQSLCTAGKREQAQQVALEYGQEVGAAPVMQEMKKCSEMAKGLMQMPMMAELQKDYDNKHVCDNL